MSIICLHIRDFREKELDFKSLYRLYKYYFDSILLLVTVCSWF